jgi:hypothetical protein
MGAGAARAVRRLDSVEPEHAAAVMSVVEAFDDTDPLTRQQMSDLDFFKKRVLVESIKSNSPNKADIESSIARLTSADFRKFNKFLGPRHEKETLDGADSPDNMSVLSFDEDEEENDGANHANNHTNNKARKRKQQSPDDLEIQNLESSTLDFAAHTNNYDSTDDDADSTAPIKIHPSGFSRKHTGGDSPSRGRLHALSNNTTMEGSSRKSHFESEDESCPSDYDYGMGGKSEKSTQSAEHRHPSRNENNHNKSSTSAQRTAKNVLEPSYIMANAHQDDPQSTLYGMLGAQHSGIVGLQKTKVWSYAHNAQLEREVEMLQKQLDELEASEHSNHTAKRSMGSHGQLHSQQLFDQQHHASNTASSSVGHRAHLSHANSQHSNYQNDTSSDQEDKENPQRISGMQKPRRRRSRSNLVSPLGHDEESKEEASATNGSSASSSVNSRIPRHPRRAPQQQQTGEMSPRPIKTLFTLESIIENEDSTSIRVNTKATPPPAEVVGHNHSNSSVKTDISSVKLKRQSNGSQSHKPRRRQSSETTPTGATPTGGDHVMASDDADSPYSEREQHKNGRAHGAVARTLYKETTTPSDSDNDAHGVESVASRRFKSPVGEQAGVEVDTVENNSNGANIRVNRQANKNLLKNLNQRRLTKDSDDVHSATEGSMDEEGGVAHGAASHGPTGVRTGGLAVSSRRVAKSTRKVTIEEANNVTVQTDTDNDADAPSANNGRSVSGRGFVRPPKLDIDAAEATVNGNAHSSQATTSETAAADDHTSAQEGNAANNGNHATASKKSGRSSRFKLQGRQRSTTVQPAAPVITSEDGWTLELDGR